MKFELLSREMTWKYCSKILIPDGAIEVLADIAENIVLDGKLFEIYREFYVNYIESGYWTTVWEPLNIHPYVEETLGQHASMFYLHAALEKLPQTEQKYSDMGISEDIFIDTLRDIGLWVQDTYDMVGYYGIRNFSWVWRHLEARMFRLGRLQYMASTFNGYVKGFYNQRENLLLLLCDSGIELRANGDMQGVCKKGRTNDGFVTEYCETDGYYAGNPVTPYGKGIGSIVMLRKDEWRKAFDKGDQFLDIHIPKDGNFDLKLIADSYLQAGMFYAKHFPELSFKGMVCHTWLFTPQLQEMLPKASKIVQFQRQFYLYPTAGSVDFLWNYVFGELTEVKDAKPDTMLRKQVLSYIREEKEIFDMNGIFLDIGGSFGCPSYMDRFEAGGYCTIFQQPDAGHV